MLRGDVLPGGQARAAVLADRLTVDVHEHDQRGLISRRKRGLRGIEHALRHGHRRVRARRLRRSRERVQRAWLLRFSREPSLGPKAIELQLCGGALSVALCAFDERARIGRRSAQRLPNDRESEQTRDENDDRVDCDNLISHFAECLPQAGASSLPQPWALAETNRARAIFCPGDRARTKLTASRFARQGVCSLANGPSASAPGGRSALSGARATRVSSRAARTVDRGARGGVSRGDRLGEGRARGCVG